MNGFLSFKMLFSTSGSSGETVSKRHAGVGWVASLPDTVQLNLVSSCCRGSHRASLRARENCLQARSACRGTEGEGREGYSVSRRGERGRPRLPHRGRHRAKPGRRDLPARTLPG